MVTQTVEALIDENGTVQLLEPIRGKGKFRALVIILDEQKESDLRPHGLCEGDFVVPNDFDDPLPDEVLAGFEGDEYSDSDIKYEISTWTKQACCN